MRLIDWLCELNKNTSLEIIREFMNANDWLSVSQLEKKKMYFVRTKKLAPVLVKQGILIEKDNTWVAFSGKPMTRGKLWKINNQNKIIKLLGDKNGNETFK